MTTVALNAWNWSAKHLQKRILWMSLVAALVGLIASQSVEARQIVLAALADAYIQVTTFVAMTLALYYGVEKWLGVDLSNMLTKNQRWQVPVAAFLGALPGCGGAIVVVTQYVRGKITFGAVLAVLTATMGDAAFLLLAQAPSTSLAIFALGFVVGTITGIVVDKLHGPDFLRQSPTASNQSTISATGSKSPGDYLKPIWITLLLPGSVLGILTAFQVDIDKYLSISAAPSPSLWLGALGSVVCVAMWALTPAESLSQNVAPQDGCLRGTTQATIIDKVAGDTNFVTAWVVLAFLTYELGLHFSGIDLKALFSLWAPAMPLVGLLLGFLPGCGPQVVVTTLYVNGLIPMSAQLANAISNDGDALFPAIALAPRAAFIATLYSAVPGLIVGYGYWAIFE
ncbi:putative manganese transporter [Aestuariispira ectoiniformans]|uniref:putative manganese transporter n=1 Tax=Aestuariispira ectoiniformans TaxID=2775080 RepID=UPI00223B8D2B|nr:putative manganese transporter [Aestuariispira ectoiniformans]